MSELAGFEAEFAVEIGGLARTDQAGYREEFARLREELLPASSAPQPGTPTLRRYYRT